MTQPRERAIQAMERPTQAKSGNNWQGEEALEPAGQDWDRTKEPNKPPEGMWAQQLTEKDQTRKHEFKSSATPNKQHVVVCRGFPRRPGAPEKSGTYFCARVRAATNDLYFLPGFSGEAKQRHMKQKNNYFMHFLLTKAISYLYIHY